jgi:NCS2 family nucleobase:cation symporter-2
MIGWSAGMAGLRLLLGAQAVPATDAEWLVAGITVSTMAALNVWAKGIVRMLCALFGLAVGYVVAAFTGLLQGPQLATVAEAAWIGIPSFTHMGWSFDATLALPFAVASIAVAMKAVGTITMCQRMNDAEWVRPDMRSATRGVLADGTSTVLAGILGAFGTSTSTPSVGLASATGVASRKVAFAAGTIFLLLGLTPKLAALLAIMPRAVMVAALMFAVAFIVINGLQVMMSRMFDVRRTLVIGLSIVAGGAVEVFPMIASAAPKSLAPLIGSSLAFSTLIALLLNLLFRMGVKKTVVLAVPRNRIEPHEVENFFKASGNAWGARPDVVSRATFGVIQLIDAVRENSWREGPLEITSSFDEFNLDVHIAYMGDALEFPERRPSNREIVGDNGARLLAGFLLRRCADRLRSQSKDGRATVLLHYDH